MKPTDPPVIVEETYPVPIATLWKSITTVGEMKQWFFEPIPEFEPVVGFATQFKIEHGGKSYLHLWRLLEVVPEQKIVYDWRYEGLPGVGRVTWNLEDDGGDTTRLKLTNEIVESFPDDDPAFLRDSCEEGWKYLLCNSLKDHIAAMS